MKFSIQKETLLTILTEQHKVVPIRTTLPILMCAHIEVKDGELFIKTTDLDQTIISQTKIKNEENGSVAVPMSKLFEIVSVLPNEEIKITSNDNFLVEINNNQGTYKITGRSVEEFPELSKLQKTNTLSIKGDLLLDVINKTAYAASKDDLKPALTGVYLNINNEKITAVSTDGHKLVKYEKQIPKTQTEEQSIIIPSKFFNILKNIINKEDDVDIYIDSDHISTTQKGFTLISRIIKEKFPDFNSVIPDNNDKEATVVTQNFIMCVKRIAIFSNKTTKQIVLNFNPDGIIMSAEDFETSASGKEHFMCDYKGEDLITSYNAKYLQEVVQHTEEKEVKMFLSSPLSAVVITPINKNKEEQLTTLLMPLRLNQ